jgi:hypothetical protein
MTHLGKESGGDTSPPIGNRIELPISFHQPESVSLEGEWVQRFIAGVVAPLQQARDLIASLVARLPRGRKPIPREPIIKVAEKAIEGGLDRSLSDFVGRVRSLLEVERIEAPKDTVLEEICRPIYLRALIIKLAEGVIEGGVTPLSPSDLLDHVRDLLKNKRFSPPEDAVLEEILRPIHMRAFSAKNSPHDRYFSWRYAYFLGTEEMLPKF